jgi:hypothetical protein
MMLFNSQESSFDVSQLYKEENEEDKEERRRISSRLFSIVRRENKKMIS